MNPFCQIYNEIKILKGKSESIEKVNIKSLRDTLEEINKLFLKNNIKKK